MQHSSVIERIGSRAYLDSVAVHVDGTGKHADGHAVKVLEGRGVCSYGGPGSADFLAQNRSVALPVVGVVGVAEYQSLSGCSRGTQQGHAEQGVRRAGNYRK